ncbi:MAG TPA: type IX secretion system membrane protein PorP/SprF [Prolixibacteraceae bacterium]|nr:type IX secretion system membrane protein PorP/SprF [Prolixibacteraceae bacterium]
MQEIKLIFGLFLLCFVAVLPARAQQEPMFTQYMSNPGIINPAYAGSSGNINVNGLFRKQWLGIDWSPTTTTISINSPFKEYEIGLGLTFIDDQIGPMHQTGLYFDYARHLRLSQNHNLSLGLKGGFNYCDIDLLNLRSNEYDPHLIMYPGYKKLLPNFGVGLMYYTNNYFLGFSVPKLVRNSIKDKENTTEWIGREERHYFLTTGFLFTIYENVLRLKPSVFARFVNGAPVSVEANMAAIMYERFWVGVSYRISDALIGFVKVRVDDQLHIGYSYDLNNSRLKSYNKGTHEIYISYDFAYKNRRILSPRYF